MDSKKIHRLLKEAELAIQEYRQEVVRLEKKRQQLIAQALNSATHYKIAKTKKKINTL